MRISYKALYEDELVSFCGVQNGNTLQRFHMSFDGVTETRDQRQDKIANRYEQLTDRAGDDHTDKVSFSWPSMVKWMRGWTGSVFPQKLLLVTKSARSKDNLYDAQYWDCVRKVWQMRVWGFFGFTLGFYLMLSPIWEVVSFLPWIDFLLAHFFWVVSIIVGFILIVTVASIAWILFHPEFLGLLLAGAGLAFHYNALVGPECTIPGGAMHTDGGRTFQSCSRDMQVGWILIAAAALPLLIFVYRFYDSWRYVTLVEEGLREADKESKV